MKINFKIKLNGMDKAKELSKEKLRRVLMKSMFKMEELAIRRAPFDKGGLRERITLLPEILSNNYVLTSAASYSADLEYGNNPRMVKLGVILEWIERKGIRTTEEDQYAFAKYVVEKIKKEGVNAQPFMRPSLIEVKEIWLPQFAKEERNK